MTRHEEAEARVEYVRKWELERTRVHQAVLRDCPAGRVVDRAHLAALLSEGASGNRSYLIWRYYVLHGLRARGLLGSANLAALNLTTETAADVMDAVLWWDPPAAFAERLPEEFRAGLIGPR
jgi:hypothetical protein